MVPRCLRLDWMPVLSGRRPLALLGLLAILIVAGVIVALTRSSGPSHRGAPFVAATPAHPNIVFVLTDDLSMDLLRYMPQVQALESRGLTFNNYFVSDSLCCPSRSSIFTGNFPHDTGCSPTAAPTADSTPSTRTAMRTTPSTWPSSGPATAPR